MEKMILGDNREDRHQAWVVDKGMGSSQMDKDTTDAVGEVHTEEVGHIEDLDIQEGNTEHLVAFRLNSRDSDKLVAVLRMEDNENSSLVVASHHVLDYS